MQLITVKNPTRRPVTLQLDQADAPKTKHPFVQHVHDRATGKVASKRIVLRLPGSLTIGAGEVKTGLPVWLSAAALTRGLQVFVQADEPAPADLNVPTEFVPEPELPEPVKPAHRKGNK